MRQYETLDSLVRLCLAAIGGIAVAACGCLLGDCLFSMADITRVQQSLATDLKTFARPDLVAQILSVGAFLIGADAAAHIRRLAVQAERMATSLERIGDNVYSQNVRGGGFPGHVHAFVRSMDEAHSHNRSADVGLATNQPKKRKRKSQHHQRRQRR